PKPIIEGPHIFGFSPVVVCISLTRAFASARRVSSAIPAMNDATLTFVALVLFPATIQPSALLIFRLTILKMELSSSPDSCGKLPPNLVEHFPQFVAFANVRQIFHDSQPRNEVAVCCRVAITDLAQHHEGFHFHVNPGAGGDLARKSQTQAGGGLIHNG